MQTVPKIVGERLKAGIVSTAHPDADVLTAYTEKSLPETERSVVVEHLARCGECREVLALALPEIELEAVSVPVHGLSFNESWLKWPALRWGFVTAGIIAIASLGVVQYQHRAAQTAAVARAVPNPEITFSPSSPTQPATPPTSAANENLGHEAQSQNKALMATKLASPKQEASAVSTGQKMMARAQAPPPSGVVVETQSASPAVAARTQNSDVLIDNGRAVQVPAQETQLADSSIPTAAPDADFISRIDKAKPAVSPQAAAPVFAPSGSNLVASTPVPTVAAKAMRLPRWTINSAGGLQRSFDQGSSWQDIDVTLSSPPPTKIASLAMADAAIATKKDATPITPVVAPPVFRAVTAIGPDVWAGGANGVLYHSADAGSHWSRILPIPGGTTVGGDIVGLEFSDPQHGKVITSTSEAWATNDGGRTWQKR
jgi:hypothetical protein